jgi:hypothetical protein
MGIDFAQGSRLNLTEGDDMKRSILAALLCTFVPLALANSTPAVPPKTKVPPAKPVPPIIQPINTPTANASSNANAAAVSNPVTISTAGAAAQSGSSQAANVLSVEAPRLATAPDVISYPTAPCRIAIGASGGWFGGAIGFSGSSLDEACSRIETSRHLHNLGMRDASVQVMCLSDEARQALEATGVKCLIKAPAQPEQVKP